MTNYRSNLGVVMPYVALSLTVLFGFAVFAVDVSQTLSRKRHLQYSTDAASLSAADVLDQANPTDVLVRAAARAALAANSVPNPNSFRVECGYWDKATKQFSMCLSGCAGESGCGSACTSCADANANSVLVAGNRAVPAVFGGALGIRQLNPGAISIALFEAGGASNCIRPFAVEWDLLGSLADGTVFTVGKNSPGNWGKIDLDGNMSSGTAFRDAMINGLCEAEYEIDETVGAATGAGAGAGGIRDVWDELVALGVHLNMPIAAVTNFGNGNSVQVTIKNFCEISFISDNGQNGSNWQGTFQLIRCDIDPPDGGGPGSEPKRVLVK